MKIEKEFVLRQIGGEYILIPVGETVAQFHNPITVNEVGVFLWKKLQNEITKDELVQAVLNEYEVDRETVVADVDDFLEALKEQKIITL